jgi:peptidylprolyl isomerase/peptidyl-prolyl cis-trans isomerase C
MQNGYLELRLSWELFKKAPEMLSAQENARLVDIAVKQQRIEQNILASHESVNVIIPQATLTTRLAEIRQRYPSQSEFAQDMQRIGLNEDQLKAAVERDLRVEAALEKVAAASPAVSTVDAEIYYRLRPESFNRPEARQLRHILITFNNHQEKSKASQQLEILRSTLKNSEQFAAAALRHSQCPSAMEGGKLGTVKRQQLYPELEADAFLLAEGEISAVLESPIGLHIVRCDEILPSGMLDFAEVEAKIIEHLSEKRRSEAQRHWVRSLGK